jgi:hypothetical protein
LARLRHQRRLQSTGGGGGGGRIVANGMGGRRVVTNGGGGGSSFLRGAMSTNRITRNTSQSDAAVTQLATERREMARRMNLARQEAERLANKAAESKSASARNEARLARNRYESLRKNMNEKERETKERINKLENEKRNTVKKLNNASEKINNISAAKNNATTKLNTATKKKNLLEGKYKAAREQINEEKRLANEAVQAAKAAQLSNNQTAINAAKQAKETANAKVVELEQQFNTMKQQFNTSQREVTNLQQKATNEATKLNAAQKEVTNMKEKANKKRRNMFETLLNNFNVPMNKRVEYTKRFERGNRIGVIANELKVEAKKKKNLLEGKYKAAREQMNTNAANRKKLQENLNQSKQNVNTKIIAAAREAGNQARRAAENQAQQNINRIQKNAANEKRILENSITNAKREANELRNSTNAKIANAKQEAEAAGREAQKANNTEEMKKANNAKRNANAKVAAIEQEAKNKRKRMLEKLLNQYKVTNRQSYMNRFNNGERISVIAEEFKKQEANKIQQNKNNALREQREKNAEAVKQKEKQIRLNTLKKLKAQGRLVVHPNKGGNHESFITFQRIVENTEKKAKTNGNVSSNDLKTLQNLINTARNKKTSNARTKLTEAQAKANANARAAEQRLANEKASAEKRLTNQKAVANKEMAARRIQNAFRAKQAAAKAEANAKAKSNAEAKAKSNAEAKAKSNAEAKAKSDAEARAAANKAAKLATLLNSYKNLTNDEKVGFTRNAQTKNLNSIKRSVIELVRKKAANRKQQANAAAETKAVANRQRAFNNLLKKYPTATNDNKTEARARFNKQANISALKAFLNIRMRTRKEAEEKKKLANKAEADKRSKAKELENLFSKYDTIMGNNSGWPIRKNLVRQQYKKGKSLADIKAELNVMVEFKKKKPVYTNTGSPGPQKKMRINPVATVRNNPLFNVNPEKFGRFKSLVSQKQLAFINSTKRKSIEGQLNQAYKEKSQEKWNKSVKVLIEAQKENRTLRNAAAKNKVNSALKVRKNAMLQNIKKLNKPAQNSFVGRIPKADSAGLITIREEINQALRNKQVQNKRKLLPKAKSSNNLKKPFNKMSNKAVKPNISPGFISYRLALEGRARELIKQQDREVLKVRSYVGSEWRKNINKAKTRLELQSIDVSLRAREDVVKQLNKLSDKIKESKKEKIKKLRSYIVPYGRDVNVSLFKDKLAEITGNISKMR